MTSEGDKSSRSSFRERFFRRKPKPSSTANAVVSPTAATNTSAGLGPSDAGEKLEDIIEGVACVSYGNYYTISGVGANTLRDTFNKNYYLLDRSGAPAGIAGSSSGSGTKNESRKISSVQAPFISTTVLQTKLRHGSAGNSVSPPKVVVTPSIGADEGLSADPRKGIKFTVLGGAEGGDLSRGKGGRWGGSGSSYGGSLTVSTGAKMRNFFGLRRQRSLSESTQPNVAQLVIPGGGSNRRKTQLPSNRETKTVVSRNQKKFRVTPASVTPGLLSVPAPDAPMIGPTEFVEMYRTRGQSDSRSEALLAARAAARNRKKMLSQSTGRDRRLSDTSLHQVAMLNAAVAAAAGANKHLHNRVEDDDSPYLANYPMHSAGPRLCNQGSDSNDSLHLIIWRDTKRGTQIFRLPQPEEGCVTDEFGGSQSEDLAFARFMHTHRCYTLMPSSSKLVIFDTNLTVKKAFFALVENGLRAAPLWDTIRQDFVGMLTVTDFIEILQKYYKSPQESMEDMEEHKIADWKDVLHKNDRLLVCVDPEDTLLDAVRSLCRHKVHRLLVLNSETGNALDVLTHKRILNFLHINMKRMKQPAMMDKTLEELNIGTYNNIATATPTTPVIHALNLFVERRISALPIVNDDGRVIDIYAKSDVIGLADEKVYTNLDIAICEALKTRREVFEGVQTCRKSETLQSVVDKIVNVMVHRLVIVDEGGRVEGVISLSDILKFLILLPIEASKSEIECTAESRKTSSTGLTCAVDIQHQIISDLEPESDTTTTNKMAQLVSDDVATKSISLPATEILTSTA